MKVFFSLNTLEKVFIVVLTIILAVYISAGYDLAKNYSFEATPIECSQESMINEFLATIG